MYVKGADPELFLKNTAGKLISSVGLIGGTKEAPMPIGRGCAVQEDNVSVEFNIPPCHSAQEFIDSIQYNLEYLREKAASMDLELTIQPSGVFDGDQLTTEAAMTFGCEPDFNAWTGGRQNPKPTAPNPNLRSAGGHIHIAVPDGVDIIEVVKAMDLYVGCMMLEFDHDEDRRQLYGKAGAFRKKDYGVEYRTASNAWIASDDRIQWAWDQTEKAVDFIVNGGSFTDEQGKLIQKCINENDMEALAILKKEFQL